MDVFKKKHSLKREIESVLKRMSELSPDSDEYAKMAKNLETLYSAASKSKDKVSLDTIVTVAGSLLGIILIINHEQTGIITSKALGFIIKGRV